MMIDCDACAVRGPACGDCVVTVLLGAPAAFSGSDDVFGPDPGGIDLDRREQAAIAVLAGSGLVPPLRLVPVDRSSDVARPIESPGSGTRGVGQRPEGEEPEETGRAAV